VGTNLQVQFGYQQPAYVQAAVSHQPELTLSAASSTLTKDSGGMGQMDHRVNSLSLPKAFIITQLCTLIIFILTQLKVHVA
jgi:hypothetical protein